MAEQLMKYSEAVKKFDPVIGLETHVELSTNTKLFCPAPISFGAEPNTELTPVSLGLPGSLPVINEAAVDYAIKLGLALHCQINEWSQVERRRRLVHHFVALLRRDELEADRQAVVGQSGGDAHGRHTGEVGRAALEAALEESWGAPIWSSLKTPWLDGLNRARRPVRTPS